MLQKEKWDSEKLSNLPEANDGKWGGANIGELGGAKTTPEFPELPALCTSHSPSWIDY